MRDLQGIIHNNNQWRESLKVGEGKLWSDRGGEMGKGEM
jgi:hypothetical protein